MKPAKVILEGIRKKTLDELPNSSELALLDPANIETVRDFLIKVYKKDPNLLGEEPSDSNFVASTSPGDGYFDMGTGIQAYYGFLMLEKHFSQLEWDEFPDYWDKKDENEVTGYLKAALPGEDINIYASFLKEKELRTKFVQMTNQRHCELFVEDLLNKISTANFDNMILSKQQEPLSVQANAKEIRKYMEDVRADSNGIGKHLSKEQLEKIRDLFVERHAEVFVNEIESKKGEDIEIFLQFRDKTDKPLGPLDDTNVIEAMNYLCRKQPLYYGHEITEDNLTAKGKKLLVETLIGKNIIAKNDLAKTLVATIKADKHIEEFIALKNYTDKELMDFINATYYNQPASFKIDTSYLTPEGIQDIRKAIDAKKLTDFNKAIENQLGIDLDSYPKLKLLLNALPENKKIALVDDYVKLERLLAAKTDYQMREAFRECGLVDENTTYEQRRDASYELFTRHNLSLLMNPIFADILMRAGVVLREEEVFELNEALAQASNEGVFRSNNKVMVFLANHMPSLDASQRDSIIAAIKDDRKSKFEINVHHKHIRVLFEQYLKDPTETPHHVKDLLEMLGSLPIKKEFEADELDALIQAFHDAEDFDALETTLNGAFNDEEPEALFNAIVNFGKVQPLLNPENFKTFKAIQKADACADDANACKDEITEQEKTVNALEQTFAKYQKDAKQFEPIWIGMGNPGNYSFHTAVVERYFEGDIGLRKAFANQRKEAYEGLKTQKRVYLDMLKRLPNPDVPSQQVEHAAKTQYEKHRARILANIAGLDLELAKHKAWDDADYGSPFSKDPVLQRGILGSIEDALKVKAPDRSAEVGEFKGTPQEQAAKDYIANDVPEAKRQEAIKALGGYVTTAKTPASLGAPQVSPVVSGSVPEGYRRFYVVKPNDVGASVGIISEGNSPTTFKNVNGSMQGFRKHSVQLEQLPQAIPDSGGNITPAAEEAAKQAKRETALKMAAIAIKNHGALPSAKNKLVGLHCSLEEAKLLYFAVRKLSNGRFGPDAISIQTPGFDPSTLTDEFDFEHHSGLQAIQDDMDEFYNDNYGPKVETKKGKAPEPTNPEEIAKLQSDFKKTMHGERAGKNKTLESKTPGLKEMAEEAKHHSKGYQP